jgi:HEAT repeat protein
MRRQDELISIYGGQSPLARKFLISQMEGLSRAFDSEELLDFLQGQLADADATVRSQALFSVSQFLPGFIQRRYAVSSQTMGTWSSYGAPVGPQPASSRHDVRRRIKAPKVHQAALLAAKPLIDAMIARMADLDGWNRTRALIALGHFGLHSSQTWLIDRLRSSRPELAVGVALAESGSEEGGAAILAAVRQYGRVVPELYFLLSPAAGPQASHVLSASIVRTDTVGRMNLARALATFSVEDIKTAFDRLKEYNEGWVVCFALSAIEATGSPALLPTVIDAHRASKHWFLALQALKAAGGIKCEESIAFCLDALKDPSHRVAAVALESLVRLRTPIDRLRAAALPFLTSPDMKARVNAILAAVEADDAPEAQSLVEMLVSNDPIHRLEAAYCLGYLQSPRALELLGMLATLDPAYVVRHQAVKSLSKYPASSALNHLMPIVQGEEPRLALTAARVMSRYEDDEARTVGQAAAEALKKAKTGFTRAVLYRALGVATSRTDYPDGRAMLAGGLAEEDPKILSGVLSGWVLAGPGGGDWAQSLLSDESLEKNPRLRARTLLARWNCGDLDAPARLASMLRSGEADQVGPVLDGSLEISMLVGEAAIGLRFPELATRLSDRTLAPDFAAFVAEEGEAPPLFKERLRLPEVEFDVRASGPRTPPPDESRRPVASPPVPDAISSAPTVGVTAPPPSPPPTSPPPPAAPMADPPGAASLRTNAPTLTIPPVSRPDPPPRDLTAAVPVVRASAPTTVNPPSAERAPRRAAREALREFLSRPQPVEESQTGLQANLRKVTYLVPERLPGEGLSERVLKHPLTWVTGALLVLAVALPLWLTRRPATPEERPVATSIAVPEGAKGHLWFEEVNGGVKVKDLPATVYAPVHPGSSVEVEAGGSALLKAPTGDSVRMKNASSFVLERVSAGESGHARYRLREVAGEVTLDFKRGAELELVLDQRTVETTSAIIEITKNERTKAQELEVVDGEAGMIDPLGKLKLDRKQKLVYDE